MKYSQLKARSLSHFVVSKCLYIRAMVFILAPIPCVYATVTSGTLIVYNNLANVLSNGPGETASPIALVVYDSTGACSTTPVIPYGGLVTVSWDNSNTHSSTVCTSISQINVTPLATYTGVVQYNQTATSPAAMANPISFVAPSTPYATHLLVVAGNNPAALAIGAPSETDWTLLSGMMGPALPQYDSSNGVLLSTGVPGLMTTTFFQERSKY